MEVNTRIAWTRTLDFDRKIVRKRLRQLGASVQKTARRLVNRKKTVSGPGELPGRTTGGLFRAIKARVSRPGFLVTITPRRTKEHGGQNSNFYAAFLIRGTKRGVEPRENFVAKAFRQHQVEAERETADILKDALKPRRVRK